ncbi:PP2C family protein-serine/threonine phosphatase [Streptomyces radicis]|uniref:GAF domain-containing protein n=1 Tax=Streptomyces radicis TaxID=1750517 RepID=A0A3A9VTA8_9ACTN|nr:GAF domain-containing SpoIIE family protein phosphatase [Streptomyces radicis]RKN04225.1 GAF domain-containing protein [Streptomyces radicis]RKN14743.1 GAF domain-containing protein [Streptomyces radicis]
MDGNDAQDLPIRSLVDLPPSSDLDRLGDQLHRLAQAQGRLQALLGAVLGISSELELPAVLRRIVSTGMKLVGARYGALGVLDERGEELAEFIPLGLSAQELKHLSGTELPRGRGLLGHLIRHPEPLRVADIRQHPESAGFPEGHPAMRSLLGVAISVHGRVYGNLYLSNPGGARPFHPHDEGVIRALAGTAGIAIEHARLYEQARSNAETFQRLLLPGLGDLRPFDAAAVYRPAGAPGGLGGDWYDAVLLPSGECAAVIGDVSGHDLRAAAAMSRIRSMLRALRLTSSGTPGSVLAQLDGIYRQVGEDLITTACLAHVAPSGQGWSLSWSNAGHMPPLVLLPDGRGRYLEAEPGLPLGVDPGRARADHTRALPAGTTIVLFTDGLVERPGRSLDEGLAKLADVATAHADRPVDELCHALVEHSPADGHDDLAVLALRTPEQTGYASPPPVNAPEPAA